MGAKAGGKMSEYRALLREDKVKNCRTAAEKRRDRCQALDILTKALHGGKQKTPKRPHKHKKGPSPAAPHKRQHKGRQQAPRSRYDKALQQVVDHYCKRGSKFCDVAKELRSKYHTAKAGGKMSEYRALLREDKVKNCRTAAEKGRDRCQALDILTKALHGGKKKASKRPHKSRAGAPPSKKATKKVYSTQDFKKSLSELVTYNCKGAKDVTVLCQETRGLLRHL